MRYMFTGPALRSAWPFVGEVARSLLGVLLAIAAGLTWGSTSAAVAAGGSAAIAGATALQDSAHGRVPLVVGVSAGMGAAVFVGHLTSPHSVLFVLTVAAWCFGAGMMWAISANAGLVGAAAGALLVTSPLDGGAVREALTAALLAVGGGLTQAVLVAAWPRQRWKEQRRALSDASAWLAAKARKLVTDPAATLDPTPLIELRESFTLTERQARRRPPAHRGMYGLPERIAMTLNVLRSDAGDPAVREVLLAGADVLTVLSTQTRSSRSAAQQAMRHLNESVAALSGPTALAAQRLRAQVAETCRLHFTGAAVPLDGVDELRRPGIVGSMRAARAEMAAQLTGDSPILRHAVRLASAAAVGTVFARATGIGNGYWIALTVLMVLRPETAHTYTRCISRVVGNTVGIVAATAVTVLWHPGGLASAVLAVLLVGIAYGVAGYGYVPLSAALAAAIVFLLDVDGVTDGATMGQRVVATVLGGGLAVASHVVLPDRWLVRLRQRAGELLKDEIDYAAMVIRAFVHHLDDPDVALSAVWDRATRARSAFEAAGGSLRADTPEVRRWITAYRAALNAVTGACATLEAQVVTQPVTLDPRFIVAVDDYVDALRGELPTAGQAWNIDAQHLAEADQQLRDAAALLGKHDTAHRVMVTEIETITRHLLVVANDVSDGDSPWMMH